MTIKRKTKQKTEREREKEKEVGKRADIWLPVSLEATGILARS